MQGFKGLIPRQTLTDEAFLSIHRKAEEHRKSAQLCIDFFQLINRFFESFSAAVEKCVHDSDTENLKAPYYCLIGFVCTKLLLENKQLTESTKTSSRELTKTCNLILEDFSKYLNEFQGNLRKYQQHEQIAQELCKKYFRSHKNMLMSIQAYKNSLTDVTLIYNMDQKIKRYQTCETNYKTVISQFNAICEKSEFLTERKVKIVKNYDDFKGEFTNVIKKIGSKVIVQTKNFVTYYCNANKTIAAFLAEQKYNLSKQKLRPFFWDMEETSNLQIFIQQEMAQKRSKSSIPLIFEHPELIKQEFLETYNSQMLNYLKNVQVNIERRKSQNRRISDLFTQYFKVIERVHIIGVKEIMQNFQKLKKKLVESFGPRLASFLKSINSIFELLSGINQKLVKNINNQLAIIQGLIIEQSKLLKLFNDELKSNVQKFIGKKQLKKLKQEEFTQQASVVNINNFRKEVNQKAQFFKHLILGFEQKMSKNCEKVSLSYTNIVHDLNQSVNQFYSLCCEYREIYFGTEEFEKNFHIYESDVDSLIQKNKSFFDDLSLNILKGDNSKITFDGQLLKIDEFKKLKKPITAENTSSGQKETNEVKESKQQKNASQTKPVVEAVKIETSDFTKKQEVPLKHSNSQNQISVRKVSFKDSMGSSDEKEAKYIQFLTSKIQFKQNEQFIKSFACALSQKIVLQGRIYITNERICFHSGFNSSNIFFGGTFIQFPKQDITKIEKRMNAIFMDNSISFTTVKGELFFTSFFSRNEAYDLICKTYSINLDEHVYEFDEHQKQQIGQNTLVQDEVKEADDISEAEVQARKIKIDQILTTFPYNEAVKTEIAKQGLTAFQIFKIFYSTNQIIINKKKYPNFLVYMKEQINHKDLEVDPWDQAVEAFMNQSNIKSGAPLKITRKIRATVPVSNSGVPFMPKTAKSQQVQSLYFYSKNKWVLETEISTTGAPYTDTFKVQLRTGVTSDVAGKCHISIGFYVNFVKNTMMKSVIESKSTEQTIKASKVWLDQIKKYFAAISKAESSVKKTVSENPTETLKQELDTKNTEIEVMAKQKQAIQKELQDVKLELQKHKKMLVGLIALCVILLLLLIS